jgi:uncharacterized membrane protein YdjX (TVP38/TMEM64 family)
MHMADLDTIHHAQQVFQSYFSAHPAAVTGAFVALFTALTALCLPGAALLMLLAGASFGLFGAVCWPRWRPAPVPPLTMLGARHFLRHRVEQRYPEHLHAFNQSLQREGALYLLSLRLLPVIPFVPVNLLSGLTRLPAGTFFWISALGMLPGTALYVNAGAYLAQLQSMDQLLSPRSLATVMALGLLPLAAAWVMRRRGRHN